MIYVDCDKSIEVPITIAVCPYCYSPLSVAFEEWVEDSSGYLMANNCIVECHAEPDTESEEWSDWFDRHSYMPYVYQLPVDLKVLNWINENYRFKP